MRILYILGLSLIALSCSPEINNSSKEQPVINNQQALTTSTPTPEDKTLPLYKHVLVIIAENKGYSQIIGNAQAPNINQLAKEYGLASNFYGEVHPSEANYIALLAGSTFGIHDDDAYYCKAGSKDQFCKDTDQPNYPNHTITARSLIDQLEEKGLTWKGYFESIPSDNLKAVIYPSLDQPLYAVKHNGFMNFKRVQEDSNLNKKIVPLEQLFKDLENGNAPSYSHIVLNQCHDMHGAKDCGSTQQLIKTGDTQIGDVVRQITNSSLWSSTDNNAIVITWDEDNNPLIKKETQGCCGFEPASAANFGGGHIPTIVITNHGPKGRVDSTPYNHYSLLRTVETVFGIHEYLNEAGNTSKGVKSMVSLFK